MPSLPSKSSVQSSFQKLVFGNSGQNLRKSRYQTYLVLPNFDFLTFGKNIFSLIVGIEVIKDYYFFYIDINPFSTNVPFTDKPVSWFLLAKCLKNIFGKVTF